MDFLKWYKSTVESAGPEPPAEVWEEIRNELDLDKVWLRIEKEIPVNGRKRILLIMAAAASILLIIGAGTLLYMFSGDQSTATIIFHTENHKDLTESSFGERSIQTRPATALAFPDARQTFDEPGIRDIQGIEGYGIAGMSLPLLSRLEYVTGIREQQLHMSDHQVPLIGEDNLPGRVQYNTKGFYAGISGHIANTWLVNNKTLQGLKSDEFTASLPSFGYNLGIIAGKNIGEQFDIRTEFYFISLARQNYNEYFRGKYINNSMKFNYTSISLSGRWYFAGKESMDRHSIVIGAYAGILINAQQSLGEENISLKGDYNAPDYGIIAGYEYLYPVGNGFYLGTGFQTKFGLNNIFTGNEIIPDYLNNTRNASVNLTLSLRYNLK